jgi:hypothetical protein
MSSSVRVPLPPTWSRAVAAAALAVLAAIGAADQVTAETTVFYDEAGDAAAEIGLVGDSALAGVRWYDTYGDLRRFNFVFDAESCRRTIETSCWSREDYRAENAISAIERLSGEWGEVLVVMMGYNDSSYILDDAVDAVVAEARSQGIPHVMWLTLRAEDVAYEEPMHQANGNTYRESNRVLLEKADVYGGYLQIADWSSYSAERDEWFEYDGVHLTIDGVAGITTFIADSADAVLAGRPVTPESAPWVELEAGDSGNTVVDVQEALLAAGVTALGGADGVYGDLTTESVETFQVRQGLEVTGTVDEETAIALGLREAPPPPPEPVDDAPPQLSAPMESPRAVDGPATDVRSSAGAGVLLGAIIGAALLTAGLVAVLVRRRRARRPPSEVHVDETEPLAQPVDVMHSFDSEVTSELPIIYDHEKEDAFVS